MPGSGVTSTVMSVEESVLAWEKESVRGTAPSTAAAWREFGRVLNGFPDLGPRNALTAEARVGSGQEADELLFEGIAYGDTLEWQVRDPLVLGHVWGKETSRVAVGAFQRHTLAPTDKGQLPSMAVGMRDRHLGTAPATQEASIYLETVMPRAALRWEQVSPDGSGGRLIASALLLPHDQQTGVVGAADPEAVTATLQTLAPYRFGHATLELDGEEIGRMQSGEFTIDRRAQLAYYHRSANGDKPVEAPPEGATYPPARFRIVQDKQTFDVGGNVRTLKNLAINRDKFTGKLKWARTANQDEFAINLTEAAFIAAVARRSGQGKNVIDCEVQIRATTMEYVDANNSAFYPT